MKLTYRTVTVKYEEQYLPTPRHRKLRTRDAEKDTTVSIRCITADEAPVVFINKANRWKFEIRHLPEVRRYDGKLYEALTEGAMYSGGRRRKVKKNNRKFRLYQNSWQYNEKTFENGCTSYQKDADRYLFIDDDIWVRCGEPRYVVMTFGLGHNHGSTALMVTDCYNDNISKNCYFNALQADEAVAEARRTATARGDTDSLHRIKMAEIEVLDPSAVKCNPQMEHGDGDPFMNMLESITEAADSTTEAGLLAMAVTARHVKDKD